MSPRILRLALPIVALGLLPVAVPTAHGRPGRGSQAQLPLTSPAYILRAQRALERLGNLARGAYEPGERDLPTKEALRDFQRSHSLRASGQLDWDTFAVLPVDERPDADDDGIPDAEDRCAGTPQGKRVGHDGCPFGKP
jgi:putative peptidoglycan binding protein